MESVEYSDSIDLYFFKLCIYNKPSPLYIAMNTDTLEFLKLIVKKYIIFDNNTNSNYIFGIKILIDEDITRDLIKPLYERSLNEV